MRAVTAQIRKPSIVAGLLFVCVIVQADVAERMEETAATKDDGGDDTSV